MALAGDHARRLDSPASRLGPGDGQVATRKILFVDDNVALAENLAEIAEGFGYQAAIAASAEAAIDLVAKGEVFGIVTDFRLPLLDGIQLIETVRRSGCGIPVAVMTGYADDALLERARGIGVRRVISKPIEFSELMRLIREFDEDERSRG